MGTGDGVKHLIGVSWNEVPIQFAHTYPRQGVLARDQNATALKEGEEANVIRERNIGPKFQGQQKSLYSCPK
jgi:hypothetical protein